MEATKLNVFLSLNDRKFSREICSIILRIVIMLLKTGAKLLFFLVESLWVRKKLPVLMLIGLFMIC
jgi:hypothetical protein